MLKAIFFNAVIENNVYLTQLYFNLLCEVRIDVYLSLITVMKN